MAQHDYVIANGTGAAVRSDLNNGLAAIVSNNSGATEPGTMYAYQWWPDTTTGLLKIRNAANNAWVTVGTLASANLGLLSLAGGTMTGALAVTAGTAALPGIAVSGDLNTGITSPGADQLAISTGGTSRLAVSTTAVSSTLAVDVPLGAVGTPSLTFTGDLNTGVFSPGADTIALVTGGTNRVHVTSAGLVGIGTSAPSELLDIDGDGDSYLRWERDGAAGSYATSGGLLRIGPYGSATDRELALYTDNGNDSWVTTGTAERLILGTNKTARLTITSAGLVGIGTTASNGNGGILQLTSGITFPATAVAASDANTLDDYEEGTWTPVDSSGAGLTFTSPAGSYTKIGNLCYISGTLIFPSTANTSSAQIGGLPFGPSNATQYQNFGPPIRNNKSLSMQIFGINNTTFLLLGIGNYVTYVLNSAMTSGTMQFSFTYQTA